MTKIGLPPTGVPPNAPPPSNAPPSNVPPSNLQQTRAPNRGGGDADLAAAAQKFRRTLRATPSKPQTPTDNAAKQAAHNKPESESRTADGSRTEGDTARRAAQGAHSPPENERRTAGARRAAQEGLQPAREKSPPPQVAAQDAHKTPDKQSTAEGSTAQRAARDELRLAREKSPPSPAGEGVETKDGMDAENIASQSAAAQSAAAKSAGATREAGLAAASELAPAQAAGTTEAAQEVAELVDRIANRLSLDTSPDGTKTLSLELKGEAFGKGTVLDLQFSAEQGLVLQFRGAEAQRALPHRAALLQQLQTHTDLPVAIHVTPETDPDEERRPPPEFETPEEEG